MSTWSDTCDAIADWVTLNVPELEGAVVHKYAPWDPEELTGSTGEVHVAVWPLPETAEVAEALTTNSVLLIQSFALMYWEWAGEESSRQVLDQEAAARLLDLQEKVVGQFIRKESLLLGPSSQLRYRTCTMPARSSTSRWFALELTSWIPRDYTVG